MDDNLTLSDFIENKLVSGEDKAFKAEIKILNVTKKLMKI